MPAATDRRWFLLLAIVQGACAPRAPGRSVFPALQPVTITVGPGLEPEITWAPDSGLGWLHVGRRDRNQIIWQIEARDSTNSLMQPIRYGAKPREAVELTSPVTLEPGVEYELSVARFVDTKPLGRVLIQVVRVKFNP